MFADAKSFNESLTNWNVERVTSMKAMFAGASIMERSLFGWNPISCLDMSEMFRDAEKYSRDISSWDVSSVENFDSMFENSVYNRDLSAWDVSSGTSFVRMSYNAKDFDQNLCTWNISDTADVNEMFMGTACPETNDPNVNFMDVSPICYKCSNETMGPTPMLTMVPTGPVNETDMPTMTPTSNTTAPSTAVPPSPPAPVTKSPTFLPLPTALPISPPTSSPISSSGAITTMFPFLSSGMTVTAFGVYSLQWLLW
jgi:surface protein